MMREQRRAADAARLVQDAKDRLSRDEQLKFRSKALALPVMVRTNGLLQTVAFLEAQAGPSAGEGAHDRRLIDALLTQLTAAGFPRPRGLWSAALCDLGTTEYFRWQEEAVLCAAWIKRFTAALIEKPTTAGGR